MRIPILVLATLFSCAAGAAERLHGGFGGPTVGATVLHGDPSLVVGGRGAWLVRDRWWLGGAMTGLVPTGASFAGSGGEQRRLRLGYGGVWFGSQVFRGESMRVGVGTVAGFGWATTREADAPLDWLASVEPSVEFDVDVTAFLRVGLALGWRWLGGVEVDGLTPDALDGPTATLLAKFGAF